MPNSKQKRISTDKQVRNLAAQVPTQAALDVILMSVDNPFERKQMFRYMQPYFKFHAEFPSAIATRSTTLVRA